MSSDNKPQPERLRTRVLKGGAVLAVGSVFERGLRFVVSMILARILAPDQFGLMALVWAVNGLFEVLTEVGIGLSVIQNKNGDTALYLNAAWWFSTIRGLLLYLIGILAVPYIAAVYKVLSLAPLLRVAFLTMLFNGLTNPHLYVLQKKMKFGRYVLISQGSAFLGTLLCLGLAIWVRNVWALVVGYVAEGAVRCLLSYLLCPFHFGRWFDRQSWKELFRFSRGVVGLPFLTFIFMQADIFVLGLMCSKDILGLYSMALALASIPQIIFSKVVSPMVLPILAETQNELHSLRSRLVRMTRLLFLFGLPMVTILSVFSRSIMTVVYGPQYADIHIAYAILSFNGIIFSSAAMIVSAYLALGKPEVHRVFSVVRVIVLGVIIFPAIKGFGPTGAATSRVLCMVFAGIIQQINLSRHINLPLQQYLLTLRDGSLVSLGVFIPALIIRISCGSDNLQVLSAALLLVLCGMGILWRYRMIPNIRNLFRPLAASVSDRDTV